MTRKGYSEGNECVLSIQAVLEAPDLCNITMARSLDTFPHLNILCVLVRIGLWIGATY